LQTENFRLFLRKQTDKRPNDKLLLALRLNGKRIMRFCFLFDIYIHIYLYRYVYMYMLQFQYIYTYTETENGSCFSWSANDKR
jgi:hypothetical protein